MLIYLFEFISIKSNWIMKKNINRINFYLFFLFFVLLFQFNNTFSQIFHSSPANRLYLDQNPQATKQQIFPSKNQDVSLFRIKWANTKIHGNSKLLIGNIINNPKLNPNFDYAPNEITAVVSGKLFVIDATGRERTENSYPIPFIKDVSVLFDTLSFGLNYMVTTPLVLGIETMEFENIRDSLVYCYIAGFDQFADTVAIIRRLAVDLRKYKPNTFASLKPVFGKKSGNNLLVYSLINMSKPDVNITGLDNHKFLRGLLQFNTGLTLYNYPMPDVGDDTTTRFLLGPEVNFEQPSMTNILNIKTSFLFPNFPSLNINQKVGNKILIQDSTSANKPYIISADISGTKIGRDIGPMDISFLIDSSSRRPQIRTYFLNIKDQGNLSDSSFILLTEEYRGLDSSEGTSKIYLCDSKGKIITNSYLPQSFNPPFVGFKNHYWSVATGNVDGNSNNSWLPYYPNNIGNELIVTYSSPKLSVAGNKLLVLRYNSRNRIPKTTPPDSYLLPFDTIATQKINGWVAVVNDIDGLPNNKDEIIIVDGSTLKILRMNDYFSNDFRSGRPFTAIFSQNFPNETISDVAIADLEGDGLNDIIVTTFNKIYVLGSLNYNTLKITSPTIQSVPPHEYCPGEIIPIKWKNVFRNYGTVSLGFQEFRNGSQYDSLVIISKNIENSGDTNSFFYIVDEKVIGKQGKFVVLRTDHPDIINDSSALLKFSKPVISLNKLTSNQVFSGQTLVLTGSHKCLDSGKIEYSIDGTNWILLQELLFDSDGLFKNNITVPCLNVFDYMNNNKTNKFYIRIKAFSYKYINISDTIITSLLPAVFPVHLEENSSLCCDFKFKWDKNKVNFPCDSLTILVSVDYGKNYQKIAKVQLADEQYIWQARIDYPDDLMFRFCCESSCLQKDTTILNSKPKFITLVAPNPFKPPLETLEIVYILKKENNVTIKIFDQNNRLVAEPVKNQFRMPNIAYCDRWNGENHNGILVANGLYYISLELSDGTREIHPVFIGK